MDVDAEWLEADGTGGFASGTVGLVRTRRYHALLLAAVPAGRFVLVNGLEVFVTTPGGRWGLSSQAYGGGSVYPEGRWHVAAFTALPWPCWQFALPDGTALRHEVFVSRATQEVVLRWTADRPVHLAVRPLLSGRDYHALHHENRRLRLRHRTGRRGAAMAALSRRAARHRARRFHLGGRAGLVSAASATPPRWRAAWMMGRTWPPPAQFVWERHGGGGAGAAGGHRRAPTPPASAGGCRSGRAAASPARDVAADAYLAGAAGGSTVLAGFPGSPPGGATPSSPCAAC